ncbi:Rho-type gtpase-activating protein [Metarhizium rileyi]|uniref:Rho-type gtpase-activating protein n=1 Tax=Metarhizium rileyi (strain RCEF 4871) TaxID=1649241 RepID=A0A5C6G419_METRR|nr:Rho-type gtpase-activating protein [Metarhizium rileyi]
MAAVVDEYLDRPMDNDDVFPCKGCGEILEEGKAFELAGNRWHLDCFRCHICGTLLDSDANLLLLGDGSLICNNCTYSCNACGSKIEDLAILTGEQAFCATCFRCRNCKRKIENLRYARTSQGIFCMGCHETLMARRRKKSKTASAVKTRDKENSPSVIEKSLPALPPSAIPPNAFSNDRVDADSDTPTELSPRPRGHHRHNESSSRGSSRAARSPETSDPTSKTDGLSLPATTYRKNRNSAIYQSPNSGTEDRPESFFIPVALDPSPIPSGTAKSVSDNAPEGGGRRKERDYFSIPKRSGSHRRNESQSSTPHIAFQEKGRQPSSDVDVARLKSGKFARNSEQDQRKASVSGDEFKLQDAPVTRQGLSTRSNSSRSSVPPEGMSGKASNGVVRKDGHSSLSEAKKTNESRTSEDTDGGAKSGPRPEKSGKAITRKELPASASSNSNTSRSGQSDQTNLSDSYTQPRTAPPPPPVDQVQTTTKDSGSGTEAPEPKESPKLPRWSNAGDFSMDEDMARILGTDEGSSSILRRVSNVVRHGRTGSVENGHPNTGRIGHARSISETTRATVSPRWPKTPMGDDHPGMSHDISSPVPLTSPDSAAMLKRQLRNSEQRVAELERQFNTEKDLKSLNKKLVEKRKTVSVLDTQTELMIRQLEVLAGYVERAKETKTPIDPRELEDSAIKDFVNKLDGVKRAMSESIERLHQERDLLVEEKNQAVADRDRALMEFEQLSSKNAQLADMNNDLTHQIQGRFKSQIGDFKSPNGLGIYGPSKSVAGSSINLDASSMNTAATLVGDEEPIVENGPTVVQVRKGQVKKFNWKKGSKTMAQNVAKGVNRAVVAFQQNDRERMPHQGLVGDNIGLPYNMTVTQIESMPSSGLNGQNRQQQQQQQQQHPMDPGRQGFGFFGKKNTMPKSVSASTMATVAAAEPASTLFGSDLVERTEYERRQIPSVVTRCIEEVELRGMDQEGIYRKTGGNSQVNMIKDGFDKNENFDISDPDLDITAVTSVLKQYFRKLPIPLLTFDVYERVLESNAISDETERCGHLRRTFASMPERHSDCLEFLMFHLNRVALREPENLMSPKNLAVVFAPTIMRDLSIEREMTDMHAKNIAVQFVIENTNRIFDDS